MEKEMTSLSIGKLANQAGVNVETIRFYERRGLVVQPKRPSSGYRLYDVQVADRLRFIQKAQELGFTLNEIKELLSLRIDPRTSCSDVKARAEEKTADIDRRLATLQQMRRALVEITRTCSGNGPSSECPILDYMSRPKKKGGERHAVQER